MPVRVNDDRPDAIGSQDLGSDSAERGDDVGGWMTVKISCSDRDDRQ
jgi:hypothetical protein